MIPSELSDIDLSSIKPDEVEVPSWYRDSAEAFAERGSHPQTLLEAVGDLPGDIGDFAQENMGGLEEWVSDLLSPLLAFGQHFIMPHVAPLFGMLGGWPLTLLAFFGVRIATGAIKSKIGENVMYAVGPTHVDGFTGALKKVGVHAVYVNYQKGLVAVRRSDSKLGNAAADTYSALSGTTIRHR